MMEEALTNSSVEVQEFKIFLMYILYSYSKSGYMEDSGLNGLQTIINGLYAVAAILGFGTLAKT